MMNRVDKAVRSFLLCVLARSVAWSVLGQDGSGAQTVRDALWLWGHEAGSYNNAYKLPGSSRMTPAEAAYYLGIPNVMFVRYKNTPKPPFRQHALPLSRLNRVVWSIVGDASSGDNDRQPDLAEVLALSKAFPNLAGAIMDDFFSGGRGRYTPAQIADFRKQLHAADLPLDLYVVLYTHDLDKPVQAHLSNVDAITLWTWQAKDLKKLEDNFRLLEEIAPGQRKLLGLYLWDFGASAPIHMEAMRHQCRLGLEWLRAGRVEGLVFLANCVADLDLETVGYARTLIEQVGDEPLCVSHR